MRHRSTIVSFIVLSLALAVPANAIDPFEPRGDASRQLEGATDRIQAIPDVSFSIAPYKHLGTWVDMYDAGPWKNPEEAVLEMVERGVSTIYLETSNWHKAADLYKPSKTGRFLDAAAASGVEVVAWYVPGFKNIAKDKRRIRTALSFTSTNGAAFDGFALDIEATAVKDIPKRNRRTLRLSDWLREKVGEDAVLGAIVPDVQSTYWDDFPYAAIADRYELMLPMSYFTYRVKGRRAVREYIAANFTGLRSLTGDADLVIHNIGGIGGRSTRREARAYVNTVIDSAGIGGSYYDFPITSEKEWGELFKLSG